LDFKTGSYGLVILASKSTRRFLGLDLKTKRVSVCWLCHKTDRGRSTQNTRRDLAACFVWKQVGLGFPSLPQNWRRCDDGWCTWHHHGGCIKVKSKTDGVTPGPKAKPNAHSICAQKLSLHTYRTENGYSITNVTIYYIYY
jgi:hypothetical protein